MQKQTKKNIEQNVFPNGNHSTVNDYKNNGWNCRACERMTTKMTKKITSRYRSIPYEDTNKKLTE